MGQPDAVIPADAGISLSRAPHWETPAFAGVTLNWIPCDRLRVGIAATRHRKGMNLIKSSLQIGAKIVLRLEFEV